MKPGVVIYFGLVFLALPVNGQTPDSTSHEMESEDDDLSRHIRGAVWRSAILPGWGQIHNDQAIKAPFVVAALAGAAVFTISTNNEYRQYQRAFRYIAREDDDPTVPDSDNEFADDFDDWLAVGSPPANQTRDRRDDLRGRRDIMILVTTGVYALQILDAYVAAHLRDFDVGEDLSLGVSPTPEGPAFGLRYQF